MKAMSYSCWEPRCRRGYCRRTSTWAPNRVIVPAVSAGNIVALLGGIDEARAGDTIVAPQIREIPPPFEKLRYISEPVVTVAIEPKNPPNDLAKIVEALRDLVIEDPPTLSLKIDEETGGQVLLSGVGTLHLEIATWMLKERTKLDFVVSQPLVRFRETVRVKSQVFEGKSPPTSTISCT